MEVVFNKLELVRATVEGVFILDFIYAVAFFVSCLYFIIGYATNVPSLTMTFAWSFLIFVWGIPIQVDRFVLLLIKCYYNYQKFIKKSTYDSISTTENIPFSWIQTLLLGPINLVILTFIFIDFLCMLIVGEFFAAFIAFVFFCLVTVWIIFSLGRFNTIAANVRSIFICIYWILFIILLIGPTWHLIGRADDQINMKPPGKLYSVGNHRLHINCYGSGVPTVIFEHGYSGQSLDWSYVQPIVAQKTRTCSYDRAGYGFSDPGPFPRDGDNVANELKILLEQANITGPLLMVGHSLGGAFIRNFRSRNANRVVGMVLIDAVNPANASNIGLDVPGKVSPLYDFGKITCEFGITRILVAFKALESQLNLMRLLPSNVTDLYLKNVYKCPYTQVLVNEGFNIPRLFYQTNQTGSFDPLPLVVINAGRGINQANLAKLSTNSKLITLTDEDHYVQFYPRNAQIVAAEILTMISKLNFTQ